ncbi:hypothetical protein PISL3812_08019 [Talaromyces islandicus]|uniref:Carrier domain-containing protein n=1 Tax=Talaromyces islandicus TaxID=28573 RepID=A0A0U1M7D4_TALIS|nr:hypothetical protein PISL3812_08019 [Talaromyces islandicus]
MAPAVSQQGNHRNHSSGTETANGKHQISPQHVDMRRHRQEQQSPDFIVASYSLDRKETEALMSSRNGALNTEPMELVIAAAIDAFNLVFTGLDLLAILYEVDTDVVSGSAFRKVRPLAFNRAIKAGNSYAEEEKLGAKESELEEREEAAREKEEELKETITVVKDAYRRDPAEEWKSSQYPTEGIEIHFRAFSDDVKELGGGSLLKDNYKAPMAKLDIAPILEDGLLCIKVKYLAANITMQERIDRWITAFEQSLRSVIHLTQTLEPEILRPTLEDYPLLQLQTDAELEEVMGSCRSQLTGRQLAEIEDIFPCTPMQEGMLVAHVRASHLYQVRGTEEIKPKYRIGSIDISTLQQGWHEVVQRHQILRTVFVQAKVGKRSFLQVVLKSPMSMMKSVSVVDYENESQMLDDDHIQLPSLDMPQHHFKICRVADGGRLFCRVYMHHAIIDGFSVSLLFRDLTQAIDGTLSYQAEPQQYKAFVSYLGEQDHHASLSFWSNFLSGASACKLSSFSGGYPDATKVLRRRVTWTATQTSTIRKVCKHIGISPASFFRSIWALVLRCYTGSDDVCFGTISSGRLIPVTGNTSVVGPMIANVTCRAQMTAAMSVATLLKTMMRDYARSLPFQHCSLAEITHNQGLGGTPLFNTVVNFLAGHPKDDLLETALCTLEFVEFYDPSDYDIILEIVDESSIMSMSFNTWRSFIREDEVECIIGTFSQAIASVVADPDQTIGGLSLFSPADISKVQSWPKYQPRPIYSTIHEQVSRQAALDPAKMAVCSTSLNLTYGEIESLSDCLAHILVESGVGRGSMVPFCIEKSVWATVTMLGVLKGGAAFVPLEPAHPIARLEWFIDEIGADVIICSSETLQKVQGLYKNRSNAQNRLKVVLVEDATSRTPSPASLLPSVDPQDTAYIIFTSGSTGNPKGVVVSHQAACGSMAQCAEAFQMDSKSRVLQFSAYTWDAIVCEIFSTLDCGGIIFVPNEVERMDGLVEFIGKMKLNWLFLTPIVLRLIRPEKVTQRLTIVTIGELLGQDLIDIWHDKALLINAYGPTEICVACTAGVVKKGASGRCIGKPFGSRAWVVLPEDHNRLSPLGSIGELLIEGPNLAQGYFKDEQKTTASFLSNPPRWAAQFTLGASFRFFQTGDLVRQNIEDGSLMFVARKDTQIKINGQRVELGEVDHHLLNSESTSIRDAITMVPKDGPWKGKLVAVLSIPHYGASTKTNTIPLIPPSLHNEVAKEVVRSRRRLEDSLPAYMVPTIWVPLTELPVLLSGKIDRSQVSRWLSELDEKSKGQIQAWVDSIHTLDEYQNPTTPAQEQLQRIWANILHLPAGKVSVDRSFLSLGGDSILAITVATQSRAAGFPVTVQDLLRRKTIEELAPSAKIDAPGKQEPNSEQSSKLSPAQAFYLGAGQDQLIHPGLLISLRQSVQADELLAAVKILVGRHPMLRARFEQNGDKNCKWTQRIVHDIQDSWIFHSYQLDSVEEIEMVYADSQSDLANQPGPVFSVNLIHIQHKVPCDYILFTANALVTDVESWRIIFEDLEDILQTGAPLQSTSIPFLDWIDQETITAAASLSTEVNPDDWGLKAGYYNDLAVAEFSMSQEETEMLMTLCNHALQTTPTDLIIAAVLDAFGHVFTGRKLPTVFSEQDARQPLHGNMNIARTVGLFAKIFPISLRLADTAERQHELGSSSLKETIIKVKDCLMEAKRTHWSGKAIPAIHEPIEILFRAFSPFQTLGGEGIMLQARVLAEQRHIASLAVFEFSPSLKQDSLVIKLSFPSCIPLHGEISKWMEHCKYSLQALIRLTETLEPQPTLQDYPLLELTSYSNLDKVVNSCKTQLGLQNLAEIEDIYPCSPMQEGIILAQAKTSLSIYDQRLTWKILDSDVDWCKLQNAWQTLVDRHTMLRTVFIEYPLQEHHAVQVVLRRFTAKVSRVECKDIEEFRNIQAHRPESQGKVLHDLVICETQDGDFYCALNFNHILGDATSVQLIVQELQLAYQGHLESATPSPYAEFVSYLTRQNLRAVYQYWETALAGVEACAFQKLTDIDRDNLHLESSSTSEQVLQMTPHQIHQLRQLGTEFGITTAMLSNTIWAIILRTFLGREDVCFGYLASGRDIDLAGVETMVGPLVTLLVCHVNIHSTTRLLDLAREIQDNYLQSLPAQHYSLAEVYHLLGLQGEHLFNTVVNVVPTRVFREPGKQLSNESLDMVPVEIVNPSEFDIALDVIYTDSEAKMVLSYRPEYLSENLASSIIATISRIMDSLLENPELEVGQLKLCDELQQQSMSSWEPSDDIESQICLHETIEQRTKETPDAEAVCAHDGNFSYHEVSSLSNQLAHSLVALGVGPKICVPFCFEKSKWAVIAIIGILKAGGCCVPLDPSYPEARLKYMVDLTDAFIILASEEHVGLVKHLASNSLVVSPSFFIFPENTDTPPVTGVRASDPCYIIFSSGTTGEPKGSVLEHQSIQASSRILDNKLNFGQHSRVLQFSSYVFDVSIEEVVSLSMERMRINWIDFTPTVLRTLMPAEVPHLKTLCLGGELLGDDLIKLWSNSVDMFNIFGPSECSITLTSSKKLEPGDSGTNIGRGYKCRFWIVDPKNHHVLSPIGAIGEMLVEGGQVGRGYYKNPSQTAAAFIKNPEWSLKSPNSSDRRMYKTGDLARFDQWGNLVYLGRKDQQVKIRGQRVELGEIEFHLARHAAVNSAVAVVPSWGWGKGSLVAIVVLDILKDVATDKEPLMIYQEALLHPSNQLAEISASLQVALPRHMVPSTIIPVYSLPLLLSGKVNRRAIKLWVEGMDKETSELLRGGTEIAGAPSTELEEQLQAIWSQALDLPSRLIGVDMSFLSLGGDSISAVKVASLSRANGIAVTVQDLLRRKTIAELAFSTVAGGGESAHQDETLERAFKLSPIQALQLVEKQDQLAHSLLLSMTRHFEVDVIMAAIQLVVNRHSMLRARFWRDSDGEWKQRLVADGGESWIWRTHQLEMFEEIEKVWASNQISAGVEDSPVFFSDLFQTKNGANYLLLMANRLVVDLESWRIIFEDLEEILRTGGALQQPLSLSYQSWIYRKSSKSETIPSVDETSRFWGLEAFDGGELQASFSMNEGETQSLMTSCNSAFSTMPIELIIAALLDAFERVFNNRDLPSIFIEGSGREKSDLDVARTVGLFKNSHSITIHRAKTTVGQYDSSRTRLVEMIKMVKDACRSHGNKAASSKEPMEILFRAFDDLQRLAGDILHVVPVPHQRLTTSDTVRRTAVFEVSSTWEQGILAVRINYPARTLQHEQIIQWIKECQDSIRSVIHLTSTMEPEATLHDFPLLQLPSYAALDEVMSNCHSQLGICKLAEIEDIYPCSPMQEGMLLAQSKSTNLYNSHILWKVKSQSGKVNTCNIQRAWQAIVQRHQILRTRFIEATGAAGTFLQVVLSQQDSCIQCLEVDGLHDIPLSTGAGTNNDQNTNSDSQFALFQTATGDIYIRLAVNHAIYDADSFVILVRDFILELNYRPLPKVVPLYRDFIAHLIDQQPKRVASHWQDQLRGPSACKFPVLRSADFANSTYDRKQVILPAEQVLSIRKFCREANVTLSAFFRALWVIILKGFTGSDDTCFGTVASGRDIPVPEAQNIMGPMITLIVCRTQLDASMSFLGVLESIQNNYLSNLPFQHVSLARVYHSLGLRGGEQLFNTIVNFLGRGSQITPNYDESWTVLEEVSGGGTIEYDITFTIEELSTTIAVSLDYWSSCLSAEQAESVMSTICQAITSILEDPQQRIGDIRLFSPADASRVKGWYKSEIKYPVTATIHGRIERRAILQPAKLAVCTTGLSFTYGELNDLANRLASKLMQLGVGRGSIVPFCMEKSVWPTVAMLGVLKTGAAFVPLDPSHPPNRLCFLVNETEATVLLCSHNTYEKAKSINRQGLDVMVVEDIANTTTHSVSSLPQINPSETAYIIFTSGSTGIPKGVVVTHQAACGSLVECAKAFRLDNNSRSLQFSAYTWDAMICEIYATLDCGGTIFVPDETERMDGLVDYIKKETLNWLFLTPTVLRLIPPQRLEGQKLTIITIGELLGQDLIERWHNKAVLINAYGPTETCVACTAGVIQSVDKTLSNHIGKPFGCRAWVIVPGYHDVLSPVGGVGELIIEGPNLADGYYRDVSKTAESFIERPKWSSEPSHRFYKTGDLVRQNLDGSLIFMGRKDTQVKINGQRVELEEVEHHLSGIEGIEHAVALAPREGLLNGKLVAVFSASQYNSTTTEDAAQALAQIPLVAPSVHSDLAHEVSQFRKQLEEKLPVYMVPTVWIPLTYLPSLSSGKKNHSQIYQWLTQAYAPAWAINDDALGQLQPVTPAESKLQQIWADVLNLPVAKIGTDRSFLSLGGDSISAMKVAWQSRADGHAVTVTVQDLLQRKTIVELASMAGAEATPRAVSPEEQALKQASGFSHPEAEGLQVFPLLKLPSLTARDEVITSCCSQLSIQPADIEDIYPCSPMQEGILIAQARSSKVYDQRLTWKISSPIADTRHTAFKLQNAWQCLVNRHAILRTAFIEYPLQRHHFVQVVLHQFSAKVSHIEIEEYRSFDSSASPLLALHKVPHHLTISKTQNEVYCTLDFNHALSDATSVQIMIHELCLAYDGQLEPNAPSYSSFISHLAGQDSREVHSHWERALSGVVACTFPKQGYSDETSVSRAQESLKLNSHQVGQLYRLCSESEITIAALSSTIWAVVLSLFLGREDVCFGYLASGRDIDVEGIQHMLGPLVTLLIYHANINHAGTQRLSDLARMIQGNYLQSLPSQHYSLARVYHALGTSRKESSTQALSMVPVDAITPSEFEISLDVVYSDIEATISLSYSSDYLSKGLASSLMKTIGRIVDSLLANPTIEVGQLAVCNELEQEVLSTPSDNIVQICLHEIIRRQTLENPHAQAVCAYDGDFSYQKLWSLTNQLSCQLIGLGVKPNTYVPFCFEKSKWSVVAILSILKAGGCCVPLDPTYPKSRLEYMVNLVDSTIMLTSAKNVDLVQHMVPNLLVVDQAYFVAHTKDEDISPVTSVKPNDAAYIIFTSGTTGEPKASVLEHQSIEAFSQVLGNSLNVNKQSRVLQFASFVFDLSIEEILGTLIHGGCVCVPSDAERLDDLASTMERLQVNWANLTPTVLRTLVPASVPHLKTVISAGEPLGDDLIKTWASIPGIDMFNTYGPSECTVAATITGKIRPNDSGMNIGKGRSCRIWIANPTNHHLLSPVGAVGEILIEGRQVGRGYLKSHEQTAAAFITDPAWSKTASANRQIYKSGDLARFNEDGSLVYLGRKDQQIKIRGQRVELTEIEYHLAAHPGVHSAAAAVPRHGCITGRLVAIVVLTTPSKLPEADEREIIIASEAVGSSALTDLSTSLERTLPRHMVPSLIIPILSLPLLVSGKVNRRALKQWLEDIDQEMSELLIDGYKPDAIDPPSNDVESCIRDVFSQVLRLPLSRMGVSNSFFSLGGDSILAMQISSSLREQNIKISVQDIFEQQTIAKLAASAERDSISSVASPTRGTHLRLDTGICTTFLSIFEKQYSPSAIEDAFPCSSIQETILAAQVLEPQAWTAIVHLEVELQLGMVPVDLDMLEDAWLRVVNHHGILRTVFVPLPHDNEWGYGQVVLKFTRPSVVRREISDAEASTLDLQPTTLPPHLPAHHLTITRTFSGKTFISLQISHALYDATALSILLRDVRLAYEGATLASSAPYRVYFLNTQFLEENPTSTHWKAVLEGYQAKAIKFSETRNCPDTSSMRMVEADIGDISKIHKYCREQSTTISNLFQTVWAICLRDVARDDDICFGNMISGRELAGSQFGSVIGPCVNILPCRVRFSPTTTIHDLQKALERGLLATLSHQHCSLEKIRQHAGLEDTFLFDTYLNVRRARNQPQDCASALSLQSVDSYMFEQYQIVVYVEELDDGVKISLSYRSPLIPDDRANELLESIQHIMAAVIDGPLTRLAIAT